MSAGVIVFGGTSEGRKIALLLASSGILTHLCVATSYGEEVTQSRENLTVTAKRLDEREISELITQSGCELIIDATHPYALEISANVRKVCEKTGVEMIRIIREKCDCESVIRVNDVTEAAEILNRTGERTLLAVGSKELAAFTRVKDYRERLFVRVLPDADALQKCLDMGFTGSHIICMQGPFTQEINIATINMLNISCVVTKDSGRVGGLPEKISAAKQTGCRLILIQRPVETVKGISFDEACVLLKDRFGVAAEINMPENLEKFQPFFPLFVNLYGKRAAIVGGGKIAYRRAKTLLDFGADVCIIAPEISEEMAGLVCEKKVTWAESEFLPQFIDDMDIVIAATNSRDTNHTVREAAKQRKILVSVADCRAECTFIFPAIVQNDELVAGIVSTDNDHAAIKEIARKLRGNRGKAW